jgi:Cu(I)/Ag(I) efflux system membrane fusion protein
MTSPFDAASRGRTGVARWILILLSVAAAIAVTWWFTRTPTTAIDIAKPGATDSARGPVTLSREAAARIGVTYAEVIRAPLSADIRSVGLVTFNEARVTSIAPKVDGFVEQLFVALTGEPVVEGTPLLRLYSPMLVTAQEELLLAKKLSADVASAGSTSSDATRDAASLLSSARRRLRNWDVSDEDIARIERTGEVTKTLTLRSPVRGVVVLKNVLGGQRIMTGDALYQIADLRDVWVEGEVFERDLSLVRPGLRVVVELASMPGRPRNGTIVFVSPTVSTETRTAKIRVVMPNADFALKPGMFATIRIAAAARANVLQVPRSSVLVTGERSLVFVRMSDGMLIARAVDVGQVTSDRIEIIRGLSAGETVVASATFLIDAESNLGAALGAMTAMPSMDHTKRAP